MPSKTLIPNSKSFLTSIFCINQTHQLTTAKQKIGTNQIKSIRRTKKLGPIINEHRNEKTYLKRVSVSVSGVWLSNCVAIGEGFSLWRRRVFEGESEWFGWVSVFEGGECLRVSVFEWLILGCLSEFVFESLKVSDFESDEWVWKFETDFKSDKWVWKFELVF